jgi:molybdopterin-containing oxidoreductase family iron-sulfur binding subunit
MKTIPPACPHPETGPKYWRSLDELAETPEFRQWVEREFPAGASEFDDPVGRRHFLKLMSASFLLAGLGLTGCRRPEEHIKPFAKQPEGYVHGVPQYYATAYPTRSSAIPLVVKAHDGRPIKIEGNSLHPDSNGGTDQFAQASILNLYDPDRAVRFTRNGTNTTRAAALDALGEISKQARSSGGKGLHILAGQSSSPSRARLRGILARNLPQAKWHEFEPVDLTADARAASLAFGKPVRPAYKLDEARVIVSLDSDFIGAEEDSYLNVRRFARGRRVRKAEDVMSRLYAVEGLFTLTGANADHRLRVAPGQILGIAARLALEVFKLTGKNDWVGAVETLAESAATHAKWIAECAADLVAAKGAGLVLAGHRQPSAVQLLALAINAALGAPGKTVVFHDAPAFPSGTIAELAAALNAGQVDTLIMLDGNPAVTAPADLNWPAAQAKAGNIVRLAYYEDESFNHTGWHLPLAHFLESWGDARTTDGTLVPVQPLIEPLFGGLTELEVLARIAGHDKTTPYEIVRETFRASGGGDSEDAWEKFLHDGFLANSAAKPASVTLDWKAVAAAVSAAKPLPAPAPDKLEVVFHRSYAVDDGRFANNGWLMETPDPITKLTWDNAVLISPATAQALGLPPQRARQGRFINLVVEVELGGRKISGAIWVQPGLADNVLALSLGYGREKAGRVSRGTDGKTIGYDAYKLRTTAALHIAAGAKLSRTGGTLLLGNTQEHGAMEGRPIVREGNVEQYRQKPRFALGMDMEKPPVHDTLYPNPLDELKKTATHQWGMVIDLNNCVGCTACVVACQSENNVPIVGKDQVSRGREMHWLRLDRYFTGTLSDPQIAFQPMLCQHCEAAPCESVCPVNATVHDEEGLNLMVYNRCVGTRYCSNNCPYKVRRFNFLDYNKRPLNLLHGPFYSSPLVHSTDGQWDLARWWKNPDDGLRPRDEWDLLKLAKNPEVTVRMRGVMEKCTFCIQRIESAKIKQKVKAGASGDVRVPDGTIKTACQQACPAEAIVFGDVSDPHSEVSKLKANDRNYTVLDFLLTKPRTTYLARLRNPNPKMPDYHDMPLSMKEWKDKGHHMVEEHSSHGAKPGADGHAPKKGAH